MSKLSVLCLIFFFVFLFGSLFKYLSFHTNFFDLGFYNWIIYIFATDFPIKFLFVPHAHIFSLLYGFLYKFLPSPVLLITSQALAIVGAGLLVSGRWTVDGGQSLVGGRWTMDGGQKPNRLQTTEYRLQTILIILYLLYFPVWYNCLFDFHFEHLFVLFCAIFYWLVIGQWTVDGVWSVVSGQWTKEKRLPTTDHRLPTKIIKTTDYRLPSKTLVFLICLLCCLVKEVFALSAIMMGVYVIIRRRWLVCGSLIVVFSLLYFIFIECYAVPYFTVGKEAPAIWHNAFGYLGSNMKEVFLNLLTHPWLLITETLSDWRKLLYIIAIFGPFLFIPLLAPLELLPALPQLFISLLSHKDNFYALSSQYTAGLIVPVFVAFIYGVKRLERLNVITLKWISIFVILSSLFFHILLSPSPISRIFWFELVPQYHYTAYIPTKRDAMIKEAIKKYIPDDFNVSVSTQNSVNCAHLAHRRYYFCFPKGVTEPAKVPDFSNKSLIGLWTVIKDLVSGQWTVDKRKRLPTKIIKTTEYRLIWADYVVLDLKRQWFINDRGCNRWRGGQCHDPAFSQKFLKLVEETKKRYDLIYEKDGFMIFRRTISVLDKLNPI